MKLKLIVGVVVLAILAFTVFGERGLLNLVRYKQQSRELAEQAERLKLENQRLKAEVERLKNDLSYIERLAREELDLVKPGEIVIQFNGGQLTLDAGEFALELLPLVGEDGEVIAYRSVTTGLGGEFQFVSDEEDRPVILAATVSRPQLGRLAGL